MIKSSSIAVIHAKLVYRTILIKLYEPKTRYDRNAFGNLKLG